MLYNNLTIQRCYILNVSMPRKKTVNNYFSDEVEQAIHQFNLSDNERERNELFKIIYPALAKIAQVWRNKIKPVYMELPDEELEMDCVTFLLEKIHMVKQGKGKAFSYLTVTAKHYYMLGNQTAYKKRLRGYSLETMPQTFDVEDVPSDRVEVMETNAQLFEAFIEYMNDNFEEMFPRKVQREFANCLLEKIKTNGLSEDFNRRQMLNDISDETGIARGLVTKHVNRIAAFYSTFKEYYEVYGVKPEFSERLTITESDKEYIQKNYQHYSKRNGLSGISRKLGIRYDIVKAYVKSTL